MTILRASPKPPIGLAFEIADLLQLRGWADYHHLRMVVELDNCVADEEYEEVVAFYDEDCSLRRWNFWRSASDIVVQPLIGRARRFASIADALDSLAGTQPDCGGRKRRRRLPKAMARHGRTARPSATRCQA
jgi:hypothetical protein